MMHFRWDEDLHFLIFLNFRSKKSGPERLYDDLDPYVPSGNNNSSAMDWKEEYPNERETADPYETISKV